MSVIDQIKAKLAKYPQLRYTETGTSIEVQPEDETGFTVGLDVTSGLVVSYAGWHEEFESPEAALNCFAFGLSSDCRLRVEYQGSTPTRWVVEFKQAGGWCADSETGRIVVPFWRRRRVVYLQNSFPKSDPG